MSQMKRVIASTMVGNGLEWYDYALYGTFTALISKHFFPAGDNATALIATAKNLEDLEEPRRVIEWVKQHAGPSGIIPEQLHPYTGAHLSVAPLVWSHATFVETVLAFVEKESMLHSAR